MPNHHMANQVHNDCSMKKKDIYHSEVNQNVTHVQFSKLYDNFLSPMKSLDYIYMYIMYTHIHTLTVILKWRIL